MAKKLIWRLVVALVTLSLVAVIHYAEGRLEELANLHWTVTALMLLAIVEISREIGDSIASMSSDQR